MLALSETSCGEDVMRADKFEILDWFLNARYPEDECRQHLGRIPLLIDPNCADPVWQQITDNYPEGWNPVLGEEREKWTMTADNFLVYPGLPPIAPAAMAWLRTEQVFVYPAGWLAVLEGNDFTVARVMP